MKINAAVKSALLFPFTMLYRINPQLEQKMLFKLKCGYSLDLKNPKTYNEKIQWIKLYYKNPLMTKLCDKYLVRLYIEENGYGQNLPKLLWSGFNAEKIPWDKLPDRFVAKVTHGSGGNIICTDKSSLDFSMAADKLNKLLKSKFIEAYGEWFYGKQKPRIIIEEFLDDGTGNVPIDYKMFYFNDYSVPGKAEKGGVALSAVDTDRFTHHRRTAYDRNWNVMKKVRIGFDTDFKNLIKKPKCYDDMLLCAEKLAKPFPHLRVDFYVIGDKFYIGELTFSNGAGYDLITPRSFNEKVGSWIDLNLL